MNQIIAELKKVQLKARKELLAATAALQALGVSHGFLGSDSVRRKRHLTKAGIKAISQAQKRRWAKVRKHASK